MPKLFTTVEPQPGDSEETLLGKLLQKMGGAPLWGESQKSLLSKILAAFQASVVVTPDPDPDPVEGPKIYRALISQSGTSAPTVTVLENTIGTIVWTRNFTGDYFGTLSGAFTSGKTFIPRVLDFSFDDTDSLAAAFWLNANTVRILTQDSIAGVADSLLSNTPIEILVYP